MKKLLMILSLALVLGFTFSCQKGEDRPEEPALDIAAEKEAIKSLIDECSRTANEGDYEGYMALFDDEVIMLPPNAPTLSGIETLRAIYRNEFDASDFNLTITTEEIHVSGDIAFSRDNWVGSIDPKDGGEPFAFDNKIIAIYKRQSDSSWKFWRIMLNSNTPPATE